jgi:hypothetical protein
LWLAWLAVPQYPQLLEAVGRRRSRLTPELCLHALQACLPSASNQVEGSIEDTHLPALQFLATLPLPLILETDSMAPFLTAFDPALGTAWTTATAIGLEGNSLAEALRQSVRDKALAADLPDLAGPLAAL